VWPSHRGERPPGRRTELAHDRAAHVGYHLIGKGRRDLENRRGLPAAPRNRARRFMFAHAPVLPWVDRTVTPPCWPWPSRTSRPRARPVGAGLDGSLLLLPASEFASPSSSAWPRTSYRHGPPRSTSRRGPEDARPWLSSHAAHERGRGGQAAGACGGPGPGERRPAHYTSPSSAISPTPTAAEMPADDEILDAARAGVVDLNARLGQGRTDRFHLFHRARQWNPGEGSWIGWERKRGKLEEFNRLLRGLRTRASASTWATRRCCPASATASRWTAIPGFPCTRLGSSSASSPTP